MPRKKGLSDLGGWGGSVDYSGPPVLYNKTAFFDKKRLVMDKTDLSSDVMGLIFRYQGLISRDFVEF